MSERVTTRSDGVTTERVVEPDGDGTTYVDRGGSGIGSILIGIAILALVAVIAFFLVNQNRNDAIRTNAVTSAASSMADSTASAAKDVGNAAQDAAGAVNPTK
jgi:hypothetical protein